jgi:GAF domain-containing protein
MLNCVERKRLCGMASEYIVELKKWVSGAARQSDGPKSAETNRAIDLISKTFGVQAHEVAILGLTSDGRSLRFLAPYNLRAIGQIPLSSTTSLAARTVREKRPEIINHFSVVPHASVFEAVPITEAERGEPIQKIMSAPIVSAGDVIGVIQVSRKANVAAEAGPDFTPPELQELKVISDTLAPFILRCAAD